MNKKWLYPVLSFSTVLLIWEILGRIFKVPLYILPLPTQILNALISERGTLFQHALITLEESLIGLVLAS